MKKFLIFCMSVTTFTNIAHAETKYECTVSKYYRFLAGGPSHDTATVACGKAVLDTKTPEILLKECNVKIELSNLTTSTICNPQPTFPDPTDTALIFVLSTDAPTHELSKFNENTTISFCKKSAPAEFELTLTSRYSGVEFYTVCKKI